MSQDMHIQGAQINQFNNVSPRAIPRSTFKRNFPYRTTFNQDYLIPIFADEILPGDDVKLRMTAFTRMSTPIKPLMDNLYLETFWFFIPNRLTWSNWEKFQGQQTNPGDSVAYTIPVLDKTKAPMSTTGFAVQSIYDYFGITTLVTNLSGISALFNRAADLCWDHWFRDENLQNSYSPPTGDGPDDPAIYGLRKRNKRKDYRTSALPWPQKGTAVTVSLGTTALVKTSATDTLTGAQNPMRMSRSSTGAKPSGSFFLGTLGGGGGEVYETVNGAGANTGAMYPSNLFADLSTASPITINALRQAALYQQILELDARGGTRYVESIYSRFGVISPDFRLQRPELIGQGSTRINIYSVPQTAPTVAGQTPQGNLAAFGTNVINGDHGCSYSATEHGIILGFANVRADLAYQQAVPKMFTRSTRLDFYEPLLNGLGEQTILNQEIFAQGTAADALPSGYQERFAEYRYKDPMVTGKFRSTDPTTLDVWHLAQKFAALPVLNSSFIEEAVPMSRVLAVSTEPSFFFDASFDYTHVRPMPIRSNPGIDRL